MRGGIRLQQRGAPAILSRRDYEDRWADHLTVLQAYKILTLRYRGDYVLVTPNQYAGQARTPAGTIRIDATYPELLKELRGRFPRDHKAVPGTAADNTRATTGDPVAGTLSGMVEVLARGLPFAYRTVSRSGSAVRGSFDVGASVREFASKGISHRVVMRQKLRQVDEDLVCVWQTTADVMRENDMLAPKEARLVDTLESSVGSTDEDRLTVETALVMIEALRARLQDRDDVTRFLAYARAVLAGVDSLDEVDVAVGPTKFRFTNADALWERATHHAISAILPTGAGMAATLHPLGNKVTPMFPNGGPDIDPDVLVSKGVATWLVVDAKDYAASAPHPDGVYQVLAYARRLGASQALLVYLADGASWWTSFGDDSVTVHAIGVNVRGSGVLGRLQASCSQVVQAILGAIPATDV